MNLDKILKDYENKNFFLQNPREVKSGKEAIIFVAFFKGSPLALKVYKNHTRRAFQNNITYLEGKYYRNPVERKAVLKRNKLGKNIIQKGWVRREFYLLEKAIKKGANVPKVYQWTEDSVLMEFIGEEQIAPRLVDIELTKQEAAKALEIILKNIEIFLELGIVHSDLSAYNILWWNNNPVIIDLPQAIDIRQNPNKEMLLKRDLGNIINYFSKYLEVDKKKIYKRFNLNFEF